MLEIHTIPILNCPKAICHCCSLSINIQVIRLVLNEQVKFLECKKGRKTAQSLKYIHDLIDAQLKCWVIQNINFLWFCFSELWSAYHLFSSKKLTGDHTQESWLDCLFFPFPLRKNFSWNFAKIFLENLLLKGFTILWTSTIIITSTILWTRTICLSGACYFLHCH